MGKLDEANERGGGDCGGAFLRGLLPGNSNGIDRGGGWLKSIWSCAQVDFPMEGHGQGRYGVVL